MSTAFDLQRLLAREGEQALHQRRGALEARRAELSERAMRSSASVSPFSRRSARSMLPMMTVSRLLKSCAMPPVSWPTASIFCAWRSACSVISRRAVSCAQLLRSGASRRVRAQRHHAEAEHRQRRRHAEDQMPATCRRSHIRGDRGRVDAGHHIDVVARQLAVDIDPLLPVERRRHASRIPRSGEAARLHESPHPPAHARPRSSLRIARSSAIVADQGRDGGCVSVA